MCCSANSKYNGPSWLPDWSISSDSGWLNEDFLFGHIEHHATNPGKVLQSDSYTQWTLCSGGRLIVRGLRVGTTEWRCDRFLEGAHVSTLQNCCKLLSEALKHAPRTPYTEPFRLRQVTRPNYFRVDDLDIPDGWPLLHAILQNPRNHHFDPWSVDLWDARSLPPQDVFSKMRKEIMNEPPCKQTMASLYWNGDANRNRSNFREKAKGFPPLTHLE